MMPSMYTSSCMTSTTNMSRAMVPTMMACVMMPSMYTSSCMTSTTTMMSTTTMVCITRMMSFPIILDISNVSTVATHMVVNTLQPSVRELDMIIPVNIPCTVILLLLAKVQVFLIIIYLVFIVVWAILIVIMTTMSTTKISTRD